MMRSSHRAAESMPANAGAAALRTFLKIADAKWQLDADAIRTLLGGLPESTYYRWRQDPERANIGHDALERLSYLLGIYKALHIIYSEPSVADGWLRRPNENPVFNGTTPLARMLGGNVADLFVVRSHLDARRGVWG